MRAVFTTLLMSCILPCALAAQGIIGRVVDTQTGQPITAARVSLQDAGGTEIQFASSDSLGAFRLTTGRGQYQLHAERIGYQPITTARISVENRELVQIELRMNARAVEVEPLIVVARTLVASPKMSGFNERLLTGRRTGIGTFVTRDKLDEKTLPFVTSYLADAGVRVIGEGGKATVVARTNCAYRIWVDGVRTYDELINNAINPQDIEGIEIYRSDSDVPPQYSSAEGGYCGAIVFWTRDGRDGTNGFWRALLIGAASVTIGLLLLQL